MKNITLTLLTAVLVSACAFSPVLEPFNSQVAEGQNSAQVATVWGDNTQNTFIMIKKIDGKRTPSRKGGGYPYSVTLTPGKHQITIYLNKLLGYQPYGVTSRYIDMTLDVYVVAGHQYSIRHSDSIDYSSARVYLHDLGENMNCRYVKSGSMHQGYAPVRLECNPMP